LGEFGGFGFGFFDLSVFGWPQTLPKTAAIQLVQKVLPDALQVVVSLFCLRSLTRPAGLPGFWQSILKKKMA